MPAGPKKVPAQFEGENSESGPPPAKKGPGKQLPAGPAKKGPAKQLPAGPDKKQMPNAPVAPPRTPSYPKALALYAYAATAPDELSFDKDAILNVIQKDPSGWWEGELDGKRGWIPATYVKEL